MNQFDVVVCGLGVMGSATLHALARRGHRVLGLDRFGAGHDRGSSHGETRIIRLSYFEHPSYVPLVRRAYELWRGLENDAGQKLLQVTGVIEIGPPDGGLVAGTLAAAKMHGIAHEVLSAADVMRRHPAYRLPPHYVGVVQPDGGFLAAEASVAALQALAQRHGAEIRFDETVHAVAPTAAGARIVTSRQTIDAAAAVIAAGPWTRSLLADISPPLRVTRR